MPNLETNFVGLKLINPIIISSSGLTNTAEKIEKLAHAGAGAVVLKSLFEEQINHEASKLLQDNDYPEAADYVKAYSRSHSLDEHLRLIEQSKKYTNIPIIASINCTTNNDWIKFAQDIETAGADAIELNIFILPLENSTPSAEYEKEYYNIVAKVKQHIKIPVVVKIGYYFTNLLHTIEMLHAHGADGFVLFNRFYQPDIDIKNLKFTSSEVFSTPNDIKHSLRWTGIVVGKMDKIQIAASTGIHDASGVIKQLLAGATAVQICSTIYKHGTEQIGIILKDLTTWMKEMNYKTIAEFRGKMSYSRIKNPAVYERAQFMRYFSSIE